MKKLKVNLIYSRYLKLSYIQLPLTKFYINHFQSHREQEELMMEGAIPPRGNSVCILLISSEWLGSFQILISFNSNILTPLLFEITAYTQIVTTS